MDFGERIKIIRISISQEDFGILLDAHRNTVRAWESNNGMPNKEIINQLLYKNYLDNIRDKIRIINGRRGAETDPRL